MSKRPVEVSGVRIRGRAPDPVNPVKFEVVEPATAKPMAEVVGGSADDATLAVDAAEPALREWAKVSKIDRARALRSIAVALDEASEGRLPETVARETGKRIAEAQAEVRFSARYFEWFADVIGTSHAQVWEVIPGVRHLVRWKARGIVAVMTPWNFPVSIPARKIAPAIAAGCAVVFRPSQYAPLSSLHLSELVEPLLPAGVLNTVCGLAGEISDRWLDDPRVAGMSFTGSTSVGRHLAAEAGRRLKMVTLELGGRAPFIVCADADVDYAVEALMVAKYRNNGESCIAANNVWVHRSLWDDFVDTYAKRVEGMTVGDPMGEDIDLGPIRKGEDVTRLLAMLEEADNGGGEVISRGGARPSDGFYMRPGICLNPDISQRVWQDEVFGPVTPIRRFEGFDEVVEDNNASPYGLAGYLISRDEAKALELAATLDLGLVGINLSTPNTPQIPFGGMKASGFGGYEGGWAGLEPFIEYQSVALRKRAELTDPTQQPAIEEERHDESV